MDTPAGPRLGVCQDDAHFLALIDPDTRRVDALPLPVGRSGLRLFDTLRGNKLDKLDLESLCVVPTKQGPRLWLFGSGSAAIREVVVEVDPAGIGARAGAEAGTGAIRVRSNARFCAALRAEVMLRGAPLNLEGACVADADLVLLQRGNGAEGTPAVVRVELEELQALLDGRGEALRTLRVDPVELSALDGVALGFTDACLVDPDRLLFLAAAEASPDVIEDGAVVGSTLGILSLGARPKLEALIPLLEADGRPSRRKAEGVCLDPEREDVAFVVVDQDDPTAASELLEVELAGVR
ncbi:MAG: hypothetical protein IPK00_18165 [Deltaproteobacteria bacterium]|nr:hypothetical protein [Deltaproteobacteria bacterium]